MESKTALLLGGGALMVAAADLTQGENLTPVERYGVLGLLSLVVLGIGGGGLKLLVQLNASIAANTLATRDLAASINTLVTQNLEDHRAYAVDRDKAVTAVLGRVEVAESRIVRELERRGNTGPKE